MKVCIDCRKAVEVSIIKLRGGPVCPICGGEAIKANEFYLEAVRELNEKGYYVVSHNFECISSLNKTTSITFDECVDSLPDLPNDCYIKMIGPEDARQITLNYTFVDCETELSILRNSLNVYLWSLKLPAVGAYEFFED